jgi:protein-arginine kinase activator protein McsA
MNANSQNVSEVFTTKEITWCGLDFSHARLNGPGLETSSIVKDNLLSTWNETILKEKSKFNLRKFLRKKIVKYDMSAVNILNNEVVSQGFNSSLDISQIGSIVKSYNINSSSGIGLVFNVESFDKASDRAWLYATFFDLSSKKILFTEKLTGKGKGVGSKSFWVNAMFDIFEQIAKKKYGMWKKQYILMSGSAYNYPDNGVNKTNSSNENKSNSTNNNVEENNSQIKTQPEKLTPQIDYSTFSSQELKTQLDKALSSEDYKNAALIQQEIDKREKTEKYSSMTIEELNKQLKLALENEEYEKASALQVEIDKRK